MRSMTANLICTALICAAFTARAEDGAKIANLDASGDAEASQMIVFVSNKTSNVPGAGTAYTCFVKDGEFDSAYGLHTENDTATVGDISEAMMKKTSDKKDANAIITFVHVSSEQFDKSKATVQKYRDTKEHLDPPADVAINCAAEVMRASGLKPPYRSALRAPNPTQWFGDVAATNRKLIKE